MLDEEIKAKIWDKYFCTGDLMPHMFQHELVGPYDDFYDFTDEIPFESIGWSACGGSALFDLNTTLVLNAKDNKNGHAIFNTTDGYLQKVLHMQWKKC